MFTVLFPYPLVNTQHHSLTCWEWVPTPPLRTPTAMGLSLIYTPPLRISSERCTRLQDTAPRGADTCKALIETLWLVRLFPFPCIYTFLFLIIPFLTKAKQLKRQVYLPNKRRIKWSLQWVLVIFLHNCCTLNQAPGHHLWQGVVRFFSSDFKIINRAWWNQ